MQSKSTTSVSNPQHLIAGLVPGSGIEFFGIPETREVKWLQNGHVHDFSELPPKLYVVLANALNRNENAKKALRTQAKELKRQVELFIYYEFGGLDSKPDLVGETLQEPENFRHSRDCISLNFKKLKLDGHPLHEREIKMIDMFTDDAKDETVAEELGITRSTLNHHKKKLYTKANVFTKPALLMKAFRQQLTRVATR